MAEEDVAEAGVRESAQRFGALGVGEVTVAAADAEVKKVLCGAVRT